MHGTFLGRIERTSYAKMELLIGVLTTISFSLMTCYLWYTLKQAMKKYWLSIIACNESHLQASSQWQWRMEQCSRRNDTYQHHAGDVHVWGIAPKSSLYIMCAKPCTEDWQYIGGSFKQIDGACGNNMVIGVTTDNALIIAVVVNKIIK
jgi:hypothetical protein